MTTTIYALATPPGRSGVAVIRVSGPRAFEIALNLTGTSLTPRYAHFLDLKNSNGEVLDSGVVIGFKGPASFNGEDIVEFQVHGSRAGINAIAVELENQGAKLAEAGEFTRRALENGKLDMLQVEALKNYIDSDTEIQRKQSFAGVSGMDSAWLEDLRNRAVQAMSLVALAIDFSDEELPDDLISEVRIQLDALRDELAGEFERSKKSLSLRDGFRVAILGKPNVGKSSLLNAIAGREVAIATEIPGTTRDAIEVFVDLNGLPVIFVDTAGIRETDDKVETIGIERAKAMSETAHLRILLFEIESDKDGFEALLKNDDLIVQAKSDLHGEGGLSISTKMGDGVSELLRLVSERLELKDDEVGRFSNQRQLSALETSIAALDNAKEILVAGEAHLDLAAEYLRQSVFAIDRLVGRVDVEDMLDVIFSQFCIGK